MLKPRIISPFTRVNTASILLWAVVVISGLAWWFWTTQTDVIHFYAGNSGVPMAPTTALLLIMVASGMLFHLRNQSLPGVVLLILAGLLLFIITFVRFSQIDLHVEEFIAGRPISNSSGRISQLTALLIVLQVAAGLLLVRTVERNISNEIAASFSLLTFIFSLTLLVWYAFQSPFLVDSAWIPPAFSTSVALAFLSAATLLYLLPRVSFLKFLLGDSVFALLLRAYMLPIIGSVTLLLWLDYVLTSAFAINKAAWASLVVVFIGAALGVVTLVVSRVLSVRIDDANDAREESEKILRESESKFRGVIEQSRDGQFVTDSEGRIVVWNPAIQEITGLTAAKVLGRFIWDVEMGLLPQLQRTTATFETMRARLLAALESGEDDLLNKPREFAIQLPTGEPRVVEAVFFPIKLPEGALLCGIFRDVSARKATETALNESLRINAALADVSRALLYSTSLEDISDLVMSWARDLTESQFGFVGYIDPPTGHFISPTMTRDIWEICQVEDKTNVFTTFGGAWGWVLQNRRPAVLNTMEGDPRSSGTPRGHVPVTRYLGVPAMVGEELMGMISLANSPRDYTENDLAVVERLAGIYALAVQRVRQENTLQDALRQKDALLREVHHRVKNNLQIITSLLDLRSDGIKDAQALQVFKECQSSIRSIALVHTNLYHNADITTVNAVDYLGVLTGQLAAAYAPGHNDVMVVTDIDPIVFDLDTAIPCGLIVTEMLTNTLKYAFPKDWDTTASPPSIRLSLRQLSDSDNLELCFVDNGVGLPSNVDFARTQSLGLQLINLFTRQLRGSLQVGREHGTSYTITFPLPDALRVTS